MSMIPSSAAVAMPCPWIGGATMGEDSKSVVSGEHLGVIIGLMSALGGGIIRFFRVRMAVRKQNHQQDMEGAKLAQDALVQGIEQQRAATATMSTLLEAAETMVRNLQSRYDALEHLYHQLQAENSSLIVRMKEVTDALEMAKKENIKLTQRMVELEAKLQDFGLK